MGDVRAGSSPAFGTINNIKGLAQKLANPFFLSIIPHFSCRTYTLINPKYALSLKAPLLEQNTRRNIQGVDKRPVVGTFLDNRKQSHAASSYRFSINNNPRQHLL